MEQISFTFYRSFFEAISNLPKAADRDAAMMAICDYALNGNERQLSGAAAAVFMLAKPNIEHNRKKHENGLKGGRPKSETKSEDTYNYINENSEPNRNQNETKAEPNAKQTGVGGRRQEVGGRSRELGDIENVTKSIPSASSPYPPTDGSSCAEAGAAASTPAAKAPPKEPDMPAVITLTLNDKSEYPVTQADIDGWQELYPAVDVMQQLRAMRGWIDANPQNRKTRAGIRRFVNGWLSKEQNRGGSAKTSPPARSRGYQTAAEYNAEHGGPQRDDAALARKLLDRQKGGDVNA